jgi:hypothetical protein
MKGLKHKYCMSAFTYDQVLFTICHWMLIKLATYFSKNFASPGITMMVEERVEECCVHSEVSRLPT